MSEDWSGYTCPLNVKHPHLTITPCPFSLSRRVIFAFFDSPLKATTGLDDPIGAIFLPLGYKYEFRKDDVQ